MDDAQGKDKEGWRRGGNICTVSYKVEEERRKKGKRHDKDEDKCTDMR